MNRIFLTALCVGVSYIVDEPKFIGPDGSSDNLLAIAPEPVKLDTMYCSGKSSIHYSHDSLVDSMTLVIDSFALPVEGEQTSGYGWRWGRMHYGIDIAYCNRDTTRSMFDGVVRYSKRGSNGGYGYLCIVRHFNGLETYYAHHRKLLVEEGDTLNAGDPIGIVGSTGNSTGPHLHLEIRFLGVPINPEELMSQIELTDTITLLYNQSNYNLQ